MSLTTVTSREFNQSASRLKKAARSGPVVITERGRPAHVLLTFEEYQRLKGPKRTLADRFGDAEAAQIEFDIERDRDATMRPLDLD